MATNSLTAGATLATEVAAFVRARKALLWVETREEGRVLRSIVDAAAPAGYRVIVQDVVRGAIELDGSAPILYRDRAGQAVEGVTKTLAKKDTAAPNAILAVIDRERQLAVDARKKYLEAAPPIVAPIALAYNGDEVHVPLERVIWVLRDFDVYTKDPGIRRHLRNLAETLPEAPREGAHAIIVLSTSGDVPPDLADAAVVIKWSLPDRAELANLLDATIAGLPKDRQAAAAPNGTREAAIEAAVGLSADAAGTIFKKCLVTRGGKIDPATIREAKKRVIAACKGLEWHDPDERGLAAVGGLDVLKGWLELRRKAFSAAARAYGLPAPKGMLCIGPPGTGKSLICKAVSAAWGLPLIRVDLPAMKGGIVGQSEAAIRQAIGIIEAVGNCIVWVDEIDKAIAPAGSLDGGVSGDQLGALLTWMNDRKGGAFIVATANDVSRLPPELLRKGRFDEMFMIDLPNRKEREEIFRVTATQYKRDAASFDVGAIAAATDGYTGSEIAECFKSALFTAFADGAREPSTMDVLTAVRETVPQSRGAAAQIKSLREWARDRARPASRPDEPRVRQPGENSKGATVDLPSLDLENS